MAVRGKDVEPGILFLFEAEISALSNDLTSVSTLQVSDPAPRPCSVRLFSIISAAQPALFRPACLAAATPRDCTTLLAHDPATSGHQALAVFVCMERGFLIVCQYPTS
jgi:hypothetical protein